MVSEENDFLEDMADIDLTAAVPAEREPVEDTQEFESRDKDDDANG